MNYSASPQFSLPQPLEHSTGSIFLSLSGLRVHGAPIYNFFSHQLRPAEWLC